MTVLSMTVRLIAIFFSSAYSFKLVPTTFKITLKEHLFQLTRWQYYPSCHWRNSLFWRVFLFVSWLYRFSSWIDVEITSSRWIHLPCFFFIKIVSKCSTHPKWLLSRRSSIRIDHQLLKVSLINCNYFRDYIASWRILPWWFNCLLIWLY